MSVQVEMSEPNHKEARNKHGYLPVVSEADASEIKRRKSTATRYEKTDSNNGRQAIIKIRDLTKHFTSLFGGGSVVRAVNGISLDIHAGQVFCLLGHNGAGKTTTIGMLTGLLYSYFLPLIFILALNVLFFLFLLLIRFTTCDGW